MFNFTKLPTHNAAAINSSVMEALCSEYIAILIINIDAGEFKILHSPSNYEVFSSNEVLDVFIKNHIDKYIYIEDCSAVLNSLSLSCLREEKEMSFIVRRIADDESLRYTKVEVRKLPASENELLLTLRDVHSEVKQDMEKKTRLQKAYSEAEKAANVKNEFMHNMSHDIRTPLNAIIGYTTVASDYTDNPELMREYLNKIYTSSQHLNHIVNEIMDMGEIEAGNIELNKTVLTMRTLINQVAESTKSMMHDKQHNLRIFMNPADNTPLVIDSNHMERVLVNLLDNAAKFTDNGGDISLTIESKPAENNHVLYTIKVEDSGIGISPEFINKIFDPYERERTSTESKKDGVGIGLATVKKIIDAFHGTISVESNPGQGTKFEIQVEFEIATKSIASSSSAKAVPSTSSIKGKRVLVVDDSKVNRDIASTILEGLGAKVEIATDGDLAVSTYEATKTGYYDLILMDIQMPTLDGFEATKQIRRINRADAKAVPIIALTADVFDTTKRTAFESGMNDFLTKPINMKALTETLVKHLK